MSKRFIISLLLSSILASAVLAGETCVNSVCTNDWAHDFTTELRAPTQAASDNSTKVATTAFVRNATGALPISAFGATCNDATWAAADASDRTIIVPSGTTCTISADLTMTTLTPWIVEEGAAISVASTKALTFATGGQLNAGRYQIFTGAGTVRGLAFPKPEWWGTSDQAAAVQAALDSEYYAALNRSVLTPRDTRYGVDIGCGFYTFARTVNLRPEEWNPLQFEGCGPVTGGTRIIAADTFTGDTLLNWVGTTGAAQALNTRIGGFQLVNNATFSVTNGLQIAKDAGTSFLSPVYDVLHDIEINDFPVQISWNNGQRINFQRITMFGTSISNSICLKVHPTTTGNTVGDASFDDIICDPCKGQDLATCTGEGFQSITDTAGTGSGGYHFRSWFGYHARRNFFLSATAGTSQSDFYLHSESQMDGTIIGGFVQNGTIFDAFAGGAGSLIQNVNIEGIYSRSSNATYATYAYNFHTDGVATMDSITMRGTWLANIATNGVNLSGVSGADINVLFDASGYTGKTAIVVDGASKDVTIKATMTNCTAPYVFDYAVITQGTSSDVKVLPSVLGNCATAAGANLSSGTGIDLSGLYPKNAANGPAVFDNNGLATLLGFTVAGLPTCNAGNIGKVAYVTDATAPTYNANLTGGGAVKALAFCDGANWTAH